MAVGEVVPELYKLVHCGLGHLKRNRDRGLSFDEEAAEASKEQLAVRIFTPDGVSVKEKRIRTIGVGFYGRSSRSMYLFTTKATT